MDQKKPLKENQLGRLFLTAATLVTLVTMLVFTVTQGTRNEATAAPDNDSIVSDTTTTHLESVRHIGEWEFLTVNDEELVDTTASRFLASDKQLTRIYYGTLRLGIDMDKMPSSSVRLLGDTLDVLLPPIRLLDNDFIDETRTKSFREKGTWDNSTRSALYEKAKRQMLARCMTNSNIQLAQQNAIDEVTLLFNTLGYDHVVVHF
ncbi:MAG: DUF4230 domain-containing protein [Prevotella sp.]|nr:DUF4230 domain-containing protein [Prevotella sp.]